MAFVAVLVDNGESINWAGSNIAVDDSNFITISPLMSLNVIKILEENYLL
jgi:hypothetical protein